MQLVVEPSEAQPSCSMFPRLSLCIVYVGFSLMHRLYRAILTDTPGSIMAQSLAIRKCIIENKKRRKKKNLLGSITKMSPVLIIYHTVFSVLTPNVRQMQHHTLLIALETNYNNCV